MLQLWGQGSMPSTDAGEKPIAEAGPEGRTTREQKASPSKPAEEAPIAAEQPEPSPVQPDPESLHGNDSERADAGSESQKQSSKQ